MSWRAVCLGRKGRERIWYTLPEGALIQVAVVIPCLDEAPTIASVIAGFRRELPEAEVIVVDNGSTDGTGAIAAASGATVLHEFRRGKGNAVGAAFRQIDADVFLLVDGDGTYPPSAARKLVQPIVDGRADVVIGSRLGALSNGGFRWLNLAGNRLLVATVNTIFRARVSDLLTGYRAMSREFVRHAPILSNGFELETELTVRALDRGFRTMEVPVQLGRRPRGSASKLRVFGDGLRILNAQFALLRDYRPLTFFGAMGLLAMLAGLVPGLSAVWEFIQTHEVKIPRAVLATGLEVAGVTAIFTGVVLSTLARRFREIEHQISGIARDLDRLGARPSRHDETDLGADDEEGRRARHRIIAREGPV